MSDSGSRNHHKTMRHMIVELDDKMKAPTTKPTRKSCDSSSQVRRIISWHPTEQRGNKNKG
jgi:hypothetical protein